MFCTQCGNQLKEGRKFCTNCASPVGRVTFPVAGSDPSIPVPPAAASTSPVSRSSSALAEAPHMAPVSEIERPVPVVSLKSAAIVPPVSGEDTARNKRMSPFMWGTIGGLALGIVVAAILFSHWLAQPTVPDSQIDKSIQMQFAVDPNLGRCTIAARSQDGVVTLAGYINADSDRETAIRIAKRQRGVKKVVDFMRLTPKFEIPMGQSQAQSSTTVTTSPTGTGGGAVSIGTLRLFQPQVNASSGTVVINGVDSARPTTPFHFDWGDGSESVGFFPQTKTYSQRGMYTVKVIASYPDGSQGNAQTTVGIP
jgi:hypothetical protein